MRNTFILFAFLLSSHRIFGQGEADNWYFGVFAGLNFSTSSPIPLSGGQVYTSEGSASISDSAGNLLFYTDGVTVWNNQHLPMPNGTGLYGGTSSTQAALIAKQPGSDSLYFIFTTDEAGYSNGCCYSIVDRSLQSGLGDVIQKNIPLIAPSTEKLTGVTTQDGSKTWIVVHEWGTNAFRAYALTSSGLNLTPVISNIGSVHNTSVIQNTYGQMKFSSCGEKIAAAIGYQDTVEIFDFNIVTGDIYNPLSLALNDHVYGLEFSGNSSKLYVTAYNPDSNKLFQFDLSAGSASDIAASKTLISFTSDLYGLQIAPDGKIYAARAWNPWLGTINIPDYAGTACDFQENGYNLDANYTGVTSSLGLPNFIQSYFDDEHKNCFVPTIASQPIVEEDGFIYPNPTTGVIYFTRGNTLSNELSYTLCDLAGNEMQHFEIAGNADGIYKLDLHGLAEGVYLLKAEMSGEVSVKKIVVLQH
jgi:hypothetical protein